MTGTTRKREPSFFCASTARPRLIPASTRCGLPSLRRNEAVMAGISRAARASAKAMMWVNETFSVRPCALSAALSSARRASSVPTCRVRNEVATGMVSDCSM